MKKFPRRVECFDIAIFQGSSPAASKVSFLNGRPDKREYRHYKLTERTEGNNDYEMMREVFTRRLDSSDHPDLFLIDGGLGHLNICLEVMKEKQVEVPIACVAKGRAQGECDKLILEGGGSYKLETSLKVTRLVTDIRDEAHRFCRRLHHKLENKRYFKSEKD